MICFTYDMEGEGGIFQGATYDETFTWETDGVAVDLTGCTARAMGRLTYDAASSVWSITSAGGGIVVGGSAGTVRLILSDTVTAALAQGEGVYDVELIWPSGSVQKFMRGKFIVYPEATK